jgi:hypothetical protein
MVKNDGLTEKEALHQVSDPIISKFHPQKFFGSISEHMQVELDKYADNKCLAV